MRQIYPAGGPAAAETGDTSNDLLAELYAYPEPGGAPWVRANMIASADGAAVLAGRSGGLGGPADRRLMQVLRSLSDVILVGLRTAQVERYGPVQARELLPELRAGRPATPPIAVITGSLDLDAMAPLLTGAPAGARTIVITTRAAPADRRSAIAEHAEVIVAGEQRVSVTTAVAALAERGLARILTEGGPSLLAQIAGAGQLADLCLTVSPVLVGGRAGRILDGPLPDGVRALQLAHVLAEDGYLFCRYLRPV